MPIPRFVLFDMDDVPCRYDVQARAAHLAGLARTTPGRVHDAIWRSGFEGLADAGAIDTETYLSGHGERIGYVPSLQEWLDARKASMTPNIDVLELVDRLRRTARVAVLTNNSTLVAENIDFLFPELRSLFGADIYASAAFKASKPQAECFRQCLSMLGAAPQETLFVDDLPVNVAGAEQAGLLGHRYESPGALAACLRFHGLA